jgi:transcription elongation factor Elf1
LIDVERERERERRDIYKKKKEGERMFSWLYCDHKKKVIRV